MNKYRRMAIAEIIEKEDSYILDILLKYVQ